MSVKISTLRDEVRVCFEDLGGITDSDWCFCRVYELKDYLKTRPKDVGKVFLAKIVRYEINEDALKDALEEFFDEEVVSSENFIYHEAFGVDEFWDKETLGKVKRLLNDMLSESGYFLKKTDFEVDYLEFAQIEKECFVKEKSAKTEDEKEKDPNGIITSCPICGSLLKEEFYAGRGLKIVCEILAEAIARWKRERK